ncbi:MAG: hypothetical protein U0R17_00865 [Acidimicrobiia bacterium]
MSIKDNILYWATKKQALKYWNNSNYELASKYSFELTRDFAESFILDAKLMQMLYDGVSKDKSFEYFIGSVENIYINIPRKSINQKNLMVMLRRIAVDHRRKESQDLAKILLSKNDAKSCLGSKHFMEMLICIASFDEDSTVTRMLDYLEQKEPEICSESEMFKEARASNIESLMNVDGEVVDLPQEHKKDESEISEISNLWAKPVD